MYYCIAAVQADASLTQVGERQMSNAAERGGRLCLFVARSALSLALQALNGTPQSEMVHATAPLLRKYQSSHPIGQPSDEPSRPTFRSETMLETGRIGYTALLSYDHTYRIVT
ncbi:hypothetical protein EVAR_49385_1 [Eumeta japonica]|uniref:Uncharacterized protein n=1 Tax=Eumeta variegata TaxID=151549 RepID=A0A4C1YRX1_EUMVA|nr:hypothetical protein EVAR_49385_1 [Eumeta japonica]